MKPKKRRFAKFVFPAFIVIPAMSTLSHAAIINPDGAGNVTIVNPGDSGPNNIQTGNGIVPVIPPGPRQIEIGVGVTLNPVTGDVIEIQVDDTVGATYTITNDGSLISTGGAGNHGIDTADFGTAHPSITVVNTGLIRGASAIRANNQLILTNSGTLDGIGIADAAVFAKNGGTITNNEGGIITGVVHGIQGETGLLTVTNNESITGSNFDGITTTGQLSLTNNYALFGDGDSTVTGARNGVVAGAGSTVSNFGAISGNSNIGVQVGDNSSVTNENVTLGSFIHGGSIFGGVVGVQAGAGLTLVNETGSEIEGGSSDGVNAGINATVTNQVGATILGGEDGVEVGGGSLVTNNGTIIADVDGVYVTGGSTAVTLNNSGTITGGSHSFFGDNGADIVNLSLGSILNGDVDGEDGLDTLNFTGGLTAPGGLSNVIHGDVDIETITKSGSGVAFIGDVGESVDVLADTIGITAGGLYINGDVDGLTVGQTTINAGGTALGGTGEWDANVNITAGGISAGDIPINLTNTPSDAVGSVLITGDVVHTGNSFIRIDIDTAGGFSNDVIEQEGVGNTYTLNNTGVRVSVTDANTAPLPGVYTIVDSDENIVGTPGPLGVQVNLNVVDTGFVSTAYQSLLAANALDSSVTTLNVTNTIFSQYLATVEVDGTDLNLVVDYDLDNVPGLTGNERSLVEALGQGVEDGNAESTDLLSALVFSDLDSALGILDGLVAPGEAILAYSSSIINSNYRIHRQVQDHLAQVRDTETFTSQAPATDSKGGLSSKDAAPAVTTTTSGKFNVWGSASYDHQEYDGGSDFEDFDSDVGAFTAGFDYRIAPNFVLGFLLDGSKSDSDETADIDSFRAAIYGTYGAPLGIYADFLAGYGAHDLDFTDANSWQALATVGYALGNDQVKHGPFIGVEYTKVDFDSFDSGLVDVDDSDVDSLRGLIGYRVNGTFGRFKPFASIAYAHEFEDGSNSVDASIFGNDFRIDGAEQGSAILLSLGTGIKITDKLSASIGYRGEISTEDEGIDSHGGSVGLNYNF